MSAIDYVVWLIYMRRFSSFIVLYNLTNINIAERIREIATIKCLVFIRRNRPHMFSAKISY